MISVLTMTFAQYLRTPFETFTDKYILARGIFQALDKKEYSEKDFKELEMIELWTDEKTKVSLYKLDRVVNPSKGDFTVTDHKFTFKREIKTGNPSVTITENEIQNRLCIAIRRVHDIVMRTLKDYKIEQSMHSGAGDIDEDLAGLFKA